MKLFLLKQAARLALFLSGKVNSSASFLNQRNSQWFINWQDELNKISVE
jgi:hypothetical protein